MQFRVLIFLWLLVSNAYAAGWAFQDPNLVQYHGHHPAFANSDKTTVLSRISIINNTVFIYVRLQLFDGINKTLRDFLSDRAIPVLELNSEHTDYLRVDIKKDEQHIIDGLIDAISNFETIEPESQELKSEDMIELMKSTLHKIVEEYFIRNAIKPSEAKPLLPAIDYPWCSTWWPQKPYAPKHGDRYPAVDFSTSMTDYWCAPPSPRALVRSSTFPVSAEQSRQMPSGLKFNASEVEELRKRVGFTPNTSLPEEQAPDLKD